MLTGTRGGQLEIGLYACHSEVVLSHQLTETCPPWTGREEAATPISPGALSWRTVGRLAPWGVKLERGREKNKGQGLIPATLYHTCFPYSKTTVSFYRTI